MIAKWTIKLAIHDGVSRMANFSQTSPSHFLKSNSFRLSRTSDSWSGAGDFGAGGWLLKAGGACRDGAASGGEGGVGGIDRLGTLVTAGGNANGAEGEIAGAGEIGGAGEMGGAMGGIDLESEVFCDTLEPQRIDGPTNRRKI
jgi:hypothetical protein